jgi:hypothetical protein
MKQLSGLLLVAFLAFSCSTKKSELTALKKTDLEVANLKGSVWKIQKTIHTVGNKCSCPAAEKEECNQASFVYNEQGNLIESCDIDNNGNIDFTYKYNYDKHGVCKEIEKFSSEQLVDKKENIFEDGKLIEVKVFNGEGINENSCQYRYTGDEVSERKIVNRSGNVVATFHYEYSNGQLVSQMEKDSVGDVLTITTYNRNSKNDKIETITTFPKSKSEYKLIFEYEYDNAGNWIKQTQLYNGELIRIVMREITYYENEELVSL